ncbi:Aste57867_11415 [Aphanomyces stellatus]|uniref:Aste57867_11415 protein n=1 Tax=Aphanomyces stellatus TaxID=120398 RepID=A0A485KT01_9STRA|nr:hypothetical protein As57867_011373 [Aphanomyces stellatus]VFT88276.1 Aste57867_11415 [Aphanomyces stellatus]
MMLLVSFLAMHAAEGYHSFKKRIPNGSDIPHIHAAGHINGAHGSGQCNQFGVDFKAAGHKWSIELCQLDSDGDGATNGQELGDPCCVWQEGDAPPAASATSSPGHANNFTAADLENLQCVRHNTKRQRSDECTCAGEGCPNNTCSGCNRVDVDEGNYCFDHVSHASCLLWDKPYLWCGDE